jgi:hypothetical protein
MTSKRPIGKSEASHHAVVVTGGSNLSLRKSERELGVIGMHTPSRIWCTDYCGGRGTRRGGRGTRRGGRGARHGGGMKGDIDSKQCGIYKNAPRTGWLLSLFDCKKLGLKGQSRDFYPQFLL